MISATAFVTIADRIRDADVRAVALHWNDARRDRLMPAWRDIDPTKIYRQLPIVWSYHFDRVTGIFKGRLAGADIERAFGKTFRGKTIRELFAGSDFADVERRHRPIVDHPSIVHGVGFVFNNLGQAGSGERIGLPLAEDGIHADGILGATKYVLSKPADEEFEEFFPLA